MGHVGDGLGDADIVIPVGGGLAVRLQRTVHHDRGETGLDRGHAGVGSVAVIEVHADRNLRIDLGDRVHHVLEHDVIGVGPRAARGLNDDRRIETGGGVHDRERLLHVVDIEGRHAVIVLRRVVEQLTQRDTSHVIILRVGASALSSLSLKPRHPARVCLPSIQETRRRRVET